MRKILKRVLYFFLSFLLLVMIVIGVLLNFVFTPEKITPEIEKLINEQLNAAVRIQKVELTFFSSFPFLKAEVSNGSLIPAGYTDTSATFKKITAVINVKQLLFKKNIALRKVEIIDPSIKYTIDSTGKSNWDIMPTDATTTDSPSSSSFTIKEFKLRELSLENASVLYKDDVSHVYMTIPSTSLTLRAKYTDADIALSLNSEGKEIALLFEKQSLLKNVSVKTKTSMHLNRQTKLLTIDDTDLSLDNIHFSLAGTLQRDSINRQIIVDVESKLKVESLENLWATIPKQYLPAENITVAGVAHMLVQTKGRYGKGELPIVTGSLQVEDAALRSGDFPGKIDLFETDLHAVIDLSHAKKSELTIRQLNLNGTGIQLQSSGSVKQLLDDPIINARLATDIDLATVKKMFPVSKDVYLDGTAKATVTGLVHYDKIKGIDYKNISLDGNVDISKLDIRMNNDSLLCHVDRTLLDVKRTATQMATATLGASNFHFKYGKTYAADLQSLRLDLRKPGNSATNNPIDIEVAASGLHLRSGDSLDGKAENLALRASLVPSTDFNIASVRSSIKLDTAVFRKQKQVGAAKADLLNGQDHFVSVRDLALNFTRHKKEDQSRVARGKISLGRLQYRSGDSIRAGLRNISIRGSMLRKPEMKYPEIKTSFEMQYAGLKRNRDYFSIRDGHYELLFRKDSVRDWWPNGSVSFGKLVAFLPSIGMPMSIKNSTIGVDNHSVNLHNSKIVAGHSAVEVSGSVANLYMPKGDKQPLKINLSVKSDYIDANELMQALHKGQAMIASLGDMEEVAAIPSEDTSTYQASTEKSVFQLPGNVSGSFDLHIKQLLFGDLKLHEIEGTATVHDGLLDIPKIGFGYQQAKIETQFKYKPLSQQQARVNYSLRIYDLEMKSIKDLAPALDSLFPVAKTLDGKANLGIKGVALLDESLHPEMKSVKSIVVLEAHNITVGESEAFRELAKTFMFKNKEQTKIDSINVELLISDNQLEVLPALVEVDRYRLAVGGVQNIDMSYQYHISVLKSQIPFKTGVDIDGTMPTYKIKLSKAKYKVYFSEKEKDKNKADPAILKKIKFVQDKLQL